MYRPYCVSAVAGRKLITFDKLYVQCCGVTSLLFAQFNLISAIEQQLNKQVGVCVDRSRAELCQKTTPDYDESGVLAAPAETQTRLNVQHRVKITASSSSLPLLLPSPFSCCQYGSGADSRLQLSNRCWINNENHIRKQPQWPWRWNQTETCNMYKLPCFVYFHSTLLFLPLNLFSLWTAGSVSACPHSHPLCQFQSALSTQKLLTEAYGKSPSCKVSARRKSRPSSQFSDSLVKSGIQMTPGLFF